MRSLRPVVAAVAGSGNNWLEVDRRRTGARNRFGVGTLVTSYAIIGGQSRILLCSLQGRSGRGAQNGKRLHFGVAANQILTATGDEDEAARAPVASSTTQAAFTVESIYPNPQRVTWRCLST